MIFIMTRVMKNNNKSEQRIVLRDSQCSVLVVVQLVLGHLEGNKHTSKVVISLKYSKSLKNFQKKKMRLVIDSKTTSDALPSFLVSMTD